MLKKRTLYLLVFIISAIGLLVVQYQYLKVGLVLANSQFSKKIDEVRAVISKDLSEYNALTYSLGRTLREDASQLAIDLDSLQKMNQYYLNDYLAYQLQVSGIDAPFSYTLSSKDSVTYLLSQQTFSNEEELKFYPIPIKGYLSDSLGKDLVLQLGFSDINSYFLNQLNGLTIPGLVFLCAIILVVIWVLRSFYWQSTLITTTNDFINNLTHELKTPVFSIGIATKILEEEIPPEKQNILELIKRETQRLKIHIDKVLELASLESGKRIIHLEAVDLRPIIARIADDFKVLGTYDNIDFSYTLEEGPYCIKGEIFHLENALFNLLDNAKKYSKHPKIHLEVKKEASQLCIVVRDNGKGISKKEIKRIFTKYYRIKNDDLHAVKGYGLGLTYVKKIVKLHGGKLKVSSKPMSGTQFTILLKLLKN
ncbi:sensor histidine kinase [Leeuwenhoekiella marinoflava]|uniref:sensor histidine kinase n=1 Tax=Leeuwenhoekiella marinoflava TaxID=988 RepID=UPI000932997E|nr:HAMP domain-containing sensor histidine kinase [Leeuwenhoekiella marinoflava]